MTCGEWLVDVHQSQCNTVIILYTLLCSHTSLRRLSADGIIRRLVSTLATSLSLLYWHVCIISGLFIIVRLLGRRKKECYAVFGVTGCGTLRCIAVPCGIASIVNEPLGSFSRPDWTNKPTVVQLKQLPFYFLKAHVTNEQILIIFSASLRSLSINIASVSAHGIKLSSIPSVGRSVQKTYCGTTADWIWMPFRMVSGVGWGLGVLDGIHVPQGEGPRAVWGLAAPLVSMAYLFNNNVFDSCVKNQQYFRMMESVVHWLS